MNSSDRKRGTTGAGLSISSARRRDFVGAVALGALAATALPAMARTGRQSARSKESDDTLRARFRDPTWNRETVARIEADVKPGGFVHGYNVGTVCGVRDGEAVRPLFGFEVFSSLRVIRQDSGDYQRLCRELVFYRDLDSGALMDEWTNVYTGEKVRVVDVANDPFNSVISDHWPEPPRYGGLNASTPPPKRPLLLDWRLLRPDTVTLTRDVHLYYRNALDPSRWPRESSGPMNRVSEMFRYVFRREDVENRGLTHLPHTGVWNRITPWLPWMLMDGAPGHVVYAGTFTTVDSPDAVPDDVIRRVRSRYPQYLRAPERWQEPSYSSLENYARTQQPAPPRR